MANCPYRGFDGHVDAQVAPSATAALPLDLLQALITKSYWMLWIFNATPFLVNIPPLVLTLVLAGTKAIKPETCVGRLHV
ncbi:hypothetical protein CFIMG_004084RA [Ceratocystis fimbriata CBS 114723]|uniref:Uncharacterized protein n=1 Tax=Ceratocystis fimbriata CBS 114723 TaxID=1035309 RepID=A0A2C5X2G8_9PEZI|nr:hypothetical protein CFIMG_004084RA [Ceratocystis fimbriata CBS 114723]